MSIYGPAYQLRKIAADLRDGVYHKDKLRLDARADLADKLEQIAKDVNEGLR